jgi:hypothetical protein
MPPNLQGILQSGYNWSKIDEQARNSNNCAPNYIYVTFNVSGFQTSRAPWYHCCDINDDVAVALAKVYLVGVHMS